MASRREVLRAPVAAAAAPIDSACAGSAHTRSSASASAIGFSAGTSQPSTPSATSSGSPPRSLATTGTPLPKDSSTVIGWFSYHRDGTTHAIEDRISSLERALAQPAVETHPPGRRRSGLLLEPSAGRAVAGDVEDGRRTGQGERLDQDVDPLLVGEPAREEEVAAGPDLHRCAIDVGEVVDDLERGPGTPRPAA